MKRFIAILLIISILTPVSLTVYATEYTDSHTISGDEETKIRDNDSQTILKLYTGSFMNVFADRLDITGILADSTEIIYMLLTPLGEATYKRIRNNETHSLDPATGIPDWSDFCQYALNPSTVFDPSVNVQNVYCLDGEPSHDGVYIYYETSIGDYVLFKEYLKADETYLFPVSDFYQFAEVIYNDRIENAFLDGGGPPINEIFDLSPYLFTARPIIDFGVLLISAIAFVLIALGATVFITKRRNKSK